MTLLDELQRARVYDLAQPMERGMPVSPSHVPIQMALTRRHGDRTREDGSSGACELIVLSGHTGTHIDALCHISSKGKLFGGYDAVEASKSIGFSVLGVETIGPIVTRAILLDVAGSNGRACLAPAEPISADDLERACAVQNVQIQSGDAVLIRTGWMAEHWANAESFVGAQSGVPGVDLSGARWLASHGPMLTGSDTMAYEWIARGAGHTALPVHTLLIANQGIYIVEMMNLESLARDRVYVSAFVLAPLRVVGATGVPVRPLAFA